MPKFRCPGNEVDGPCGRIVKGERRKHPDSDIVKLEPHKQLKLDDTPCRRLWVFYDECVVEESWGEKYRKEHKE